MPIKQNAEPKNENQRQMLNFQQNLKKTSVGINFGKKLFTNPQSMTTGQITETLRALGLNVPKEVQITADLAQAWTTGQAVADSYETYKNTQDAKDLKNFTNVTAAAARVGTNVAQQNGWVNDDTASVMRVGISAARIVASGGADVGAWVDLCMELGAQSEGAKAKAAAAAFDAAMGRYREDLNGEITNVTNLVSQLESGEIGIFSFLSGFADKGTMLFSNCIQKNPKFEMFRKIFPGLAFIPSETIEYVGDAQSSTWYGDTKGATYKFEVSSIAKNAENTGHIFLYSTAIRPYSYGYLQGEKYYQSLNKASLFSYAILANISNNGFMSYTGDVIGLMNQYQLTPSDIGVMDTFNNYVKPKENTAISSNFGLSSKRVVLSREQIQRADQVGRIDILSNISEVNKLISEKFSYPKLDFEKFIEAQKNAGFMNYLSSRYQDFRNMANLITVMNMIDYILRDPLLEFYVKSANEYSKGSDELAVASKEFLETLELFEPIVNIWSSAYEDAWKLSTLRLVNLQALNNVRYFLGQDKITQANQGQLGPAIFK